MTEPTKQEEEQEEEQPGDGDTDEEFSDEEWEATNKVSCEEGY